MKELLRHSIKTAFRHKSCITLIYIVTFLVSLILGVTVLNGLQQDLGNSLALEDMTNGFNRTVIEDWMSKHKETFGAITNSAKLAFISYLLFAFFLNTALLSNVVHKQYSLKPFIRNGVRNFLPFLGITLIGLIIIGLCLAILYLPYISLIGNPLEDYKTEVPFIYSLIGMGLLTTLLFVKVWAWATFTKAHYITCQSLWQSIKLGAKSLRQHIWKVLFVGLILILVGALIWVLFVQLSSSHSAGSWTKLFLVFALSQVLVWVRIFVKTWGYVVVEGIRVS